MKHCTANIIMNSKGEILLLKRAIEDEFHGGTWCLAGGNVDEGENSVVGVVRETKEEAGIDEDKYSLLSKHEVVIKAENVKIDYFISELLVADNEIEPFIILDEIEHCNYEFCSVKQWKKMDLILDLKQHLMDILKTEELEKGGIGSGRHKEFHGITFHDKTPTRVYAGKEVSIFDQKGQERGTTKGDLQAIMRGSDLHHSINDEDDFKTQCIKLAKNNIKNVEIHANKIERFAKLPTEELKKAVNHKHLKSGVDKTGHKYTRMVNDEPIPAQKPNKPEIKVTAADKPKKEVHWSSEYHKYDLSKYPSNMDRDKVKVRLDGDIDTHAVLSWRDPKSGKQQDSYTKEFRRRSDMQKWDRMKNVSTAIIDSIKVKSQRALAEGDEKLKNCAAVIKIIANTGLRIGSRENFSKTGNRGVCTLAPDSVKVVGNKIYFSFVGKSYKDNLSFIEDAQLAKFIKASQKSAVEEKREFLFTVDRVAIDNVFKKTFGYKSLKLKDMRTYIGTSVCKDVLYENKDFAKKLTNDPKLNKKIIQAKLDEADLRVSKVLNNTPKMARESYIHPAVKIDWLTQLGVNVDEFRKSMDFEALVLKNPTMSELFKRSQYKTEPFVLEENDEDEDGIYNKLDWELETDNNDELKKGIDDKPKKIITKVAKTVHRQNGTTFIQRFKHKEDTGKVINDGVGNKDINIRGFDSKEKPVGTFEQRVDNFKSSSQLAGLKDKLSYSVRFGEKYYDKNGIEIKTPSEYKDVILALFDNDVKTIMSEDKSRKNALKMTKEQIKEVIGKISGNNKSVKSMNDIADELFEKYKVNQKKEILKHPEKLKEALESTIKHIGKNSSSISAMLHALGTTKELVNKPEDLKIKMHFDGKDFDYTLPDFIEKLSDGKRDKNKNMGVEKLEIVGLDKMGVEDFNIENILEKSKRLVKERIFSNARKLYVKENKSVFNESLKQNLNLFQN